MSRHRKERISKTKILGDGELETRAVPPGRDEIFNFPIISKIQQSTNKHPKKSKRAGELMEAFFALRNRTDRN